MFNFARVAWAVGFFGCSFVAAAAEQPNVAPLSADGGRYVFGQINHQRSDQFMLDTKTGRLWRVVTNSGGGLVLEPVLYSDANDNRMEYPKEIQPSQQQPAGSARK